ncbi:MAG: peptide chain release factor 1 [Firmicutes bacterium]|nr:peptide chain release factor 1 [Bacillota bacterium]
MIQRLQTIQRRYEELNELLSDPAVISQQERWKKLAREHAALIPVMGAWREYRKVSDELKGARELLAAESEDEDMRAMAEAEAKALEQRVSELEQRLRILLLPRDPAEDRDVIVEIRAGTGGEEAALFAGNLLRMYVRYAESKGWRVEEISSHQTELGGYKEIIAGVSGQGVYNLLKHESGVHRVQRIPSTEAGGRIHTSTATVAVLPEAEEVDVRIAPEELRVDTYCSSGPGGQGVNTTYSAVRLTHLPTGLVVTCQDERSQHKNKEKAMRVLRARLMEIESQKQMNKLAQERKSQVGTGERSERIRTYNFPQNRVTDHRIGLTLHKLGAILEGELEDLVVPLVKAEEARRLSEAGYNDRVGVAG